MNNMPAIADQSPNPNLGLDNKKDSDPCSMTGVGVIATLRCFVAGAGFEPATSGLRVQALEATLPAALDSFSEGAVRCTLPERQRRRQHRHRWPARPGRAARRHCITARTEAVAA